MSLTAGRRRVLRRLIDDRSIRSQSDIVDLLAAEGYAVTQATVSRDLHAIGAMKDDDDRYVLVRPEERSEAEAALARALDEFAQTIFPSGNLVVITTPPGAAQVVAASLDQAGLEGVLGTVAGDDTILVVAAESVGGKGVADHLDQIGVTA